MGMIIALILFVVIVVWFIIYPIILIFKCLFDSAVSASTKILIVLTSFLLFPIPSFCYGAFIKESKFCKVVLAIYAVLLVVFVSIVIFAGGLALFTEIAQQYGVDVPGIAGVELEPTAEVEQPEERYRGYNTYDTDDVNVFKSGKAAEEE